MHPDVSEEFELAHLEVRVGRELNEALRNMVDRTGVGDLRSLVVCLEPGRSLQQIDREGSSEVLSRAGESVLKAVTKRKGARQLLKLSRVTVKAPGTK